MKARRSKQVRRLIVGDNEVEWTEDIEAIHKAAVGFFTKKLEADNITATAEDILNVIP